MCYIWWVCQNQEQVTILHCDLIGRSLCPCAQSACVKHKWQCNLTCVITSCAHTRTHAHTHTHTLPAQRVELRFHPHPDDSSVSTLGMRVLSTTPATTVGHLVKYLAVRNALQRKEREGTGWLFKRCLFLTHCLRSVPILTHVKPNVPLLWTPLLQLQCDPYYENLQTMQDLPFDVHG